MIIRIVQMEFEEAQIPDFMAVFASRKNQIKSFRGCVHLQLLQDQADPCIFFTYSHWKSEEDLEAYRNSDFFQAVWGNTKKLFRAAPKVWSLTDHTEIDSHTR